MTRAVTRWGDLPEKLPERGPRFPDPTPEEAAYVDDLMAKRREQAARMLENKKATPPLIAAACRLPLREVYRLQGEMRVAKRKEAAGA